MDSHSHQLGKKLGIAYLDLTYQQNIDAEADAADDDALSNDKVLSSRVIWNDWALIRRRARGIVRRVM